MMMNNAVDTVLDRSVALGYGKPGLEIRRRLPGWPADPPRIEGTVVLITGAASGIGRASAQGFARLGATVHALARNDRRAAEAVEQIARAVPGADVRPASCDLSSLAAIRAFAEEFAERQPRLDVLVNNAGVMPDERERSEDGHELMFATHVLAPLALSALLAPLLERSAPSRVINVSSGGMYGQGLPVGDWESELASYGPKKFYARTKREEVVVTELLAERLRERGIVVHSMHPGWVDTEGVSRWMPVFRKLTAPIIRTPEQGADTVVWLGAAVSDQRPAGVTDPSAVGVPGPLGATGLFWHDRRPRPTHYRLGASEESEADRQALWRYCQEVLVKAEIDGL